jgi:xanthine dehydrogenase molybdopterin-binding subunit B
MSSDLNGRALQVCFIILKNKINIIQDACRQLLARLQPVRTLLPADKTGDWRALISRAYIERVCMSATGFGTTDTQLIDYNCGRRQTASTYNYFVYGAACAEVEVDCLTGDHQVRHKRVDTATVSAGDSRRLVHGHRRQHESGGGHRTD